MLTHDIKTGKTTNAPKKHYTQNDHSRKNYYHYHQNKCIGDDMKAAARQSLNCIKNQKKIWWSTIFNMADGILTPCTVARSLFGFWANHVFAFWRQDPRSAILDFRGPMMGSLKSPCTTFNRSSIESIARNCSLWENRVLVYAFWRQKDFKMADLRHLGF